MPPITEFTFTGEVGSLLLAPPIILTGVPQTRAFYEDKGDDGGVPLGGHPQPGRGARGWDSREESRVSKRLGRSPPAWLSSLLFFSPEL